MTPEDTRLPFREDLKRKLPGLAKRAEKGHPLPSIRLACVECSGGLSEVEGCPDKGCFLWPLRMGHRPQPRADREGQNRRKAPRPTNHPDHLSRRKKDGLKAEV